MIAKVSIGYMLGCDLIAERCFGHRMVSTAGISAGGFAMIDLPQLLCKVPHDERSFHR